MSESNPKILIVDDREENRYILGHILRRAGFSVEEAASGRDALAKSVEHPDLIVLDVKLPDINGYEVCRRIKSNSRTAGIPVLQLSANFTTSESKVQALEGGADSYLIQPVDPVVFVATVKSLLRTREAEMLARNAARQWQSTFDALSEGIGLIDRDGVLTKVNRAMTVILKRNFGQLEGKKVSTLLESALGFDVEFDLSPTTRRTFEVQQNTYWYRVTLDPVMDENRELAGEILVIADITQSRQVEAALRLQDRLASTGKLAHVIAHEINNPLEAITNLLYLLEQHTSGLGKDYLSSAQEQLDRISRITKQTLEFNREAARPGVVDFQTLIGNVASVLRRDLEARSIELQYDVKTGSHKFHGYGGEIRQVLVNLIMNAADASNSGGKVRVRVREVVKSASGRRGVRITVADTGSGIPENIRNVVFEPFFTTKELKGSGLGLWLSRSLIIKRGGYLRFRTRTSEPSGTCFSFFLPSLENDVSEPELVISARAV
jgi:PAS domain S-box-containing protein